MAKQALTAAWKSRRYKSEKKFVLIYLSMIATEVAKDQYEAEASSPQVADMCGLSQGGACRILQALVSDGVIEIVKKGGGRSRPNVYRLHIERFSHSQTVIENHSSRNSDSETMILDHSLDTETITLDHRHEVISKSYITPPHARAHAHEDDQNQPSKEITIEIDQEASRESREAYESHLEPKLEQRRTSLNLAGDLVGVADDFSRAEQSPEIERLSMAVLAACGVRALSWKIEEQARAAAIQFQALGYSPEFIKELAEERGTPFKLGFIAQDAQTFAATLAARRKHGANQRQVNFTSRDAAEARKRQELAEDLGLGEVA